MINFFGSKQKQEKSGNGKVISLLNQKGGVGKTTMAFNLARALAEKGHKVLALDMDPQSNLSLLFGSQEENFSIHHLLVNSIKELRALHSQVIMDEIIEHHGNKDYVLDLLASSQDLSGFELTVSGISSPRQLILKRFMEINSLKNHYDYIVIDGPPTLGLLVVNILCASDGVLVPFQPDQFSRSGLKHFHQVLEDIEDMGITSGPQVLGYIPNLVDTRRKQVKADFEKIASELKRAPLFEGFSNKVQMVRASAKKKSVFDYASKEYRPLQEQFLEMAQMIGEKL
jgi:chromosome partitioning protein